MPMKIATWNVNSILARLPHVTRWLETEQPDVLCVQETKCTDDKFPLLEIKALGYDCVMLGQQSYNGVAIISKAGCARVQFDRAARPGHVHRHVELQRCRPTGCLAAVDAVRGRKSEPPVDDEHDEADLDFDDDAVDNVHDHAQDDLDDDAQPRRLTATAPPVSVTDERR